MQLYQTNRFGGSLREAVFVQLILIQKLFFICRFLEYIQKFASMVLKSQQGPCNTLKVSVSRDLESQNHSGYPVLRNVSSSNWSDRYTTVGRYKKDWFLAKLERFVF